jgi:hypothetical protein
MFPADALLSGGQTDAEGGLEWESELEAWQRLTAGVMGQHYIVEPLDLNLVPALPPILPTISGHRFPPL